MRFTELHGQRGMSDPSKVFCERFNPQALEVYDDDAKAIKAAICRRSDGVEIVRPSRGISYGSWVFTTRNAGMTFPQQELPPLGTTDTVSARSALSP